MKSKYLKDFIEEIKYNNRNPQNIEVLELLDNKSTNPEIIINANESLYRARVVIDEREIGKQPGFYGYDAKDSFIPPIHLTRDSRANYRYIPYLYCANNAYIALAEVRPRIGAMVSIATIVAKEPLTLLDFTIQERPSRMSETKKKLFEDISVLFSIPVTHTDDVIDYIPTQFIAEYAKNRGYDGIAFSSSVTPEFYLDNPARYNVVIFNYKKCKVVKSNIVTITRTYLEGVQIDKDSIQLNINSRVEEELDEIGRLLGNI